MEKRYRVKVRLERVDGGIPAHPNVVKDWLSQAGIQDDEELAKQIAEGTIKEDELEERLEKITTTFLQNDKNQPCLEARCVKAAIKQSAGVMGLYAIAGLRELLKEGLEVYPKLIPFGMNSNGVKTDTKIMHVVGPQGPRSAFKRSRYVENVEIEFEVHVMDRLAILERFAGKGAAKLKKATSTVTLEQLKLIVEHALKYTGFGSNRSQGQGKGELVEIKEVEDGNGSD